jgi:hypothetical protein
MIQDHPDLRGHQPDPARGHGPAAAEGLVRAADLQFLQLFRRRRVAGPESLMTPAHACFVRLILVTSGRFWSACWVGADPGVPRGMRRARRGDRPQWRRGHPGAGHGPEQYHRAGVAARCLWPGGRRPGAVPGGLAGRSLGVRAGWRSHHNLVRASARLSTPTATWREMSGLSWSAGRS